MQKTDAVSMGALITHVDAQGLDIVAAADALSTEVQQRRAWVTLEVTLPALTPGEALRGWSRVLEDRYGTIPVSPEVRQQHEVRVQVGPTSWEVYPVGPWYLQDAGATVTFRHHDQGRAYINVDVRRMHRPMVEGLLEEARTNILTDSLYRGAMLAARWEDSFFGGSWALDFLSPWEADLDALRYNADTTAAIRGLVARLKYRDQLPGLGIAPSSGVLVHGPYGTGKTRLMRALAGVAVAHGWTYVQAPRPEDVASLYDLTADLGPVLIGVEDLDSMESGHVFASRLRNTLDGVQSQGREVMVIATSNAASRVDPGLLRHGRLGKLYVGLPNASTAADILKMYGGEAFSHVEDWEAHGGLLDGQPPATIARAVEASKLHALDRTSGASSEVRDPDVEGAILSLLVEARRTSDVEDVREASDLERAAAILADSLEGHRGWEEGDGWEDGSMSSRFYGAGGADLPLG